VRVEAEPYSTLPGRLSWNDWIDQALGDAMGERVTDKSGQSAVTEQTSASGHTGKIKGSEDMTGHSGVDTISGDLHPPQEGALEAGLQAYIGQQLRTVYDEVLNEAIPDRLLALLQELERKQADKS
jgi:hypothetical protein